MFIAPIDCKEKPMFREELTFFISKCLELRDGKIIYKHKEFYKDPRTKLKKKRDTEHFAKFRAAMYKYGEEGKSDKLFPPY